MTDSDTTSTETGTASQTIWFLSMDNPGWLVSRRTDKLPYRHSSTTSAADDNSQLPATVAPRYTVPKLVRTLHDEHRRR